MRDRHGTPAYPLQWQSSLTSVHVAPQSEDNWVDVFRHSNKVLVELAMMEITTKGREFPRIGMEESI